MPKSTNHFTNYLNHLIEYQTQLLPDRNLCSDYIILYDYLVDLLEKDDVIGEFIVRQKQQSKIYFYGWGLYVVHAYVHISSILSDPIVIFDYSIRNKC